MREKAGDGAESTKRLPLIEAAQCTSSYDAKRARTIFLDAEAVSLNDAFV